MIRRPPRSTRTDTLCPYTTLFRSCDGGQHFGRGAAADDEFRIFGVRRQIRPQPIGNGLLCTGVLFQHMRDDEFATLFSGQLHGTRGRAVGAGCELARSDERRVGNESVSTCRSRWSPLTSNKNINYTLQTKNIYTK